MHAVRETPAAAAAGERGVWVRHREDAAAASSEAIDRGHSQRPRREDTSLTANIVVAEPVRGEREEGIVSSESRRKACLQVYVK